MKVGAVVIGRNEGPKLRRSLASVLGRVDAVVFVDSGSEDDSVEVARALGVEVVELDPALPFTVARARNQGFVRLVQRDPEIDFVQFVDADSDIVASWIERAVRLLRDEPRCALVFGHTRERFPRKSVHTRIYSVSYHPGLADPQVSGGMAMVRVSAFRQMGGFVSSIRGLEDRELSFRLCKAGWRIVRLDVDMAVHEAGMDSFAHWWRRRVNSGASLAHENALHHPPLPLARRSSLSSWFWGLAVPGGALTAAWPTDGVSLFLLGGHLALIARIYRRTRRAGVDRADAALYAGACVLSKFPQALGQIRFHVERMTGKVRVALPEPIEPYAPR